MYGSTREVAEDIAATLQDEGLTVDVREMQSVVSLRSYDAVILGAPIYLGRWHADARAFLDRLHGTLVDRPVAIFALGPVGNDESLITSWRGELGAELKHYRWLDPIAMAVFGGKYDPEQLDRFHKGIAELPSSELKDMPASDLRDWDQIRAWAREVAEMVRSETSARNA
jgi:menaquinone-dependent protoporphyrinogen oxidase